jgi:hypothetical protein
LNNDLTLCVDEVAQFGHGHGQVHVALISHSKQHRSLSIGFKPLESEPIKGTYSEHFKTWEWLELSPVTIPANMEGQIHAVKNIDRQQRAAFDQRSGVVFLDPSTRRVCRKEGVVYLDPKPTE